MSRAGCGSDSRRGHPADATLTEGVDEERVVLAHAACVVDAEVDQLGDELVLAVLERVGDLRRRVALAAERLDAGDTFVFCHQKTTDAAGHTKDPAVKRDTIAELDAALDELPTDRAIVCVTGDHATPASPDVIHSGDPVPLLVVGPGVRADGVTSFGELPFAAGILGQLRGPDLMPVLLNAADRPLFLGSRPTPFEGADGYPALLEPLL